MSGPGRRRLFVALPVPAPVAAALDARVAPLRASLPGLRWVPADRWHLTLTFLGDVADADLPELEQRLGRAAARSASLRLRLGAGGRFGGRVLWVGVDGDRDALRRLAERTTAAARRTGIDVERRRLRPHLTVARASRPTDLRPLVGALADPAGPEWTATHLALVHSTLGEQARYDTVATYPLTAS